MKIAILNDKIPPEGRGGAEQTALHLAKGLVSAGHNVDLITTTEKKPFHDVREGIIAHHLYANYPIRFRSWLSLFNPQVVGPLYRLLEKLRPDVLHFHNIHLNLSYTSLSIGHRLKIPTVFTAHDLMSFAYGKVAHGIDPARRGRQSPQQAKLPRFYNAQLTRLRYNPLRNPT